MINVFSQFPKNRMFYDSLTGVIYICLRCGDTEINPDMQIEGYYSNSGTGGHSTQTKYYTKYYAIKEKVSQKKIDFINQVLSDGKKQCLKTFMERRNFLQSKFNLKDCDLVALNPIKELEDIRNKLQIKNKEN